MILSCDNEVICILYSLKSKNVMIIKTNSITVVDFYLN